MNECLINIDTCTLYACRKFNGDFLYMLIEFQVNDSTNISWHFKCPLLEQYHALPTKGRKYHTKLKNYILTSARLTVLIILRLLVPVIIWSQENDTKCSFFVNLLLESFDQCLRFSIVISQNIRIQLKATEHKFKLLERRNIVAMDDKNFGNYIR